MANILSDDKLMIAEREGYTVKFFFQSHARTQHFKEVSQTD